MAYIGKEPQVGNYSVLDALSASSTASYTMQLGSTNFTPESANHLIVSLNGVIQKPGSSYTVSGSTITFSSSLTSSDSIDFIIALGNVLDIGTPSDNTIATAKIVDDAVTPAKASFFNADISAADLGAGLHVKTADSGGSANSNADELVIEGSGATGIQLLTAAGNGQGIYFGDADDNDIGKLVYNHDGNKMQFFTNNSERARIDSNGITYIGKTSSGLGTAGHEFNPGGITHITSTGADVLYLNRLTNDGTMLSFYQATASEGYIGVSGSTVSYNGFTGTHWSRLADNSKPTILKGTVLETLDEMCDWYNLEFNDNDGNPQKIPHVLTDSQSIGDKITYDHNGTDYEATITKENDIKHMKTKVSDTTDAKNVYGVFNFLEDGEEGYNDFIVASVGTFVVRIHKDQTVAKGDLLQSNGDGTAKKQSADNVKSSSFAKVLSNTKIETYSDGSYIVPCSLMC